MPYYSRSWSRSSSLIGKNEGKIIKSLRPFGVEIECQYDEEEQVEAVAKAVDEHIGFKGDGSIRGNGVEICTPPASGDKAEDMMKVLCKALNDQGFSVDKSCGLHVHIDTADLHKMPFEFFQRYWLFAIVMDDVIRSFLTLSRRQNSYCKAIEPVYEAVSKAKSMHDLQEINFSSDPTLIDMKWRAKMDKDPTRYRGFNFQGFFGGNSNVEIRYHNGTTNGARILHWANLHCLILDKIVDGTITMDWIKTMKRKYSIENKTKRLFEVLGLAMPSQIYFKARQAAFFQKWGYQSVAVKKESEELTAHPF